MAAHGVEFKSARPIQESIHNELVLDIGIAERNVDLSRHAFVAQGHRSRPLADVDLIDPFARDEFHALQDVQPACTGLVVEHDLGVLAVEAQHPNLLRTRHRVRETGVHRRVGLKGLAQIAAGRPAQLIPTERLDHQRVQKTHGRRRALGHDLSLVELEPLSQRNFDVGLPDERQFHRGHSDEAGHQCVSLHTIQPEEPVGIRGRALTRALPDHIGTRQRQPVLFFPPLAWAVVMPGMVDLILGKHLALDGDRFLRGYRQRPQNRNRSQQQ